ncbi:MAG: hypothetical protein UY92_C0016G0004 [Candidatus Magasanikbacteria bacterium GW2011_GWA2_56_11]|uniref:Trp repressor n=1 Tax=Candidatus Magasanikbacteria bacterium GW2011_GWA2_56_11 TaxID=1619044 RepID=A0A0G2B7Y4_9BACT|nr:MAG: hypothetical protein UY92_C0016G0004 [Candidatus Magasanikbacteria bacterium GW2011_GWA2_56_11]
MDSYWRERYRRDLSGILCRIDDPKIMAAFLDDLLTPAELDDIIVRWQIVRQLDKKKTQREVAENLGISIAKVTRGARELSDNKGGFRQILSKE